MIVGYNKISAHLSFIRFTGPSAVYEDTIIVDVELVVLMPSHSHMDAIVIEHELVISNGLGILIKGLRLLGSETVLSVFIEHEEIVISGVWEHF